jgi:hypothetical protein
LTALLVGWLSGDKGEEFTEIAVEKLIDCVGQAAPLLLARLDSGKPTETEERNIADVLAYAKRDDRIFGLLSRLFGESEGDDTALYASYLGRYGDERALPGLIEYGTRDDINYMQFIEIRNAVESLGGTLENDKDFTDDPYFQALKE